MYYAAKTEELLDNVIGFSRQEEQGDYVRLVSEGTLGNTLDIKQTRVGAGQMGVGTVHHIAFRVADEQGLGLLDLKDLQALLVWTGENRKELGLPHWDEATERQRHDGMCWKEEGELYNDGQAFKLTTRDESGVVVTMIADNYFGYCKKEVKAQISYSANLYGMAEEEHAGGALAFPCRNHGEEYGADSRSVHPDYTFEDVAERYASVMDMQPEGYGIDRQYPDVIYLPQRIRMDLHAQTVSWENDGERKTIALRPGKIYMQPNGYKVEMEKHPGAPSWRLVGTDPEGTFCHKPCTVSGGGKSEISKSLNDAVIYRPLFVDDLDKDLDRVQEIFDRDYTRRFKPGHEHEDRDATRKPLSSERSLGSVIKLLTKHTSAFAPGFEDTENLQRILNAQPLSYPFSSEGGQNAL